jgi:hypothetical protein
MELVGRIADSISLIGYSHADPIVVRKDGNIYYVIDGGHRLAAAKSVGLDEIPAVIEDLDDAGVLTYEGSLNLQRPDTEDERWARAQSFFALGITGEASVEVATGLSIEQQRKAYEVVRKLNDDTAAEDVTLEQALRAHDFVDDDEAFTAIMTASRNDWIAVASKHTRQRNLRNAIMRCRGIIDGSGVELLETQPTIGGELSYLTRGDEKPEGATAARVCEYEWNGSAEIVWYGQAPAEDDAEAAAAGAAREARAQHEAELAPATTRRLAFVHACLLGEMGECASLAEFAEKAWEGDEDDSVTANVDRLKDVFGDVQGFLPRVYAAILADVDNDTCYLLKNLDDEYYLRNHGPNTLAYFEALEAAGFEFTEVERNAWAAIAEALKPEAQAEVEGDGDDDE